MSIPHTSAYLNSAVLLPCRSKLVVVRNFTSDAAKVIVEPLDFVYVDARHDYCGAWEDMELYWPKVRCLLLPAVLCNLLHACACACVS